MSVPSDGRYQSWAGNPKGYARDEKRCWDEVFPVGRELHHQCGRRWTVERDGQRFCAQHDPVAEKVRKDAREARWKAESEASSRKWARERAVYLACEGVPTEQLTRGILARLLVPASSVSGAAKKGAKG